MIQCNTIQRGKYVRECNVAMKNRQYFAKKADEERELRLMLRDPKNWLSEYFGYTHDKEEIVAFLEELSVKLGREGYEVSTFENFIGELK